MFYYYLVEYETPEEKKKNKEGSGSENTSMFTVYIFMSTLIYNII